MLTGDGDLVEVYSFVGRDPERTSGQVRVAVVKAERDTETTVWQRVEVNHGATDQDVLLAIEKHGGEEPRIITVREWQYTCPGLIGYVETKDEEHVTWDRSSVCPAGGLFVDAYVAFCDDEEAKREGECETP